MTGERAIWPWYAWRALVLVAFAAVPAGLCQFLAQAPSDRSIHMDAFRYGKDPSIIHCNRGDRLHLTFSARHTGHSFFLEEFDVDAKIEPGRSGILLFSVADPELPPETVSEVIITARHPGWLGYLVSKSQYRCHVWCGPMHAFEHGNLIIWPNSLLFAGFGLLVGIPAVGLLDLGLRRKRGLAKARAALPTDGWDCFGGLPWLKSIAKRRGLQYGLFGLVSVTMALLYVVILTTLFGSEVAGLNLGVMLTWVVWLFLLTAVLTPLGGRIWCLACPLPGLGELLQRRAVTGVRTGSTRQYKNRFFGLNLSWPRWLANDWPRTFVFLTMGTFSSLLVAIPRFSGFVICGLLVLATAMALVWELRAFCRYLCPVTAFVGLYSNSGMLGLRAANPDICRRCKLRSCQLGSDKGWACPYGLCVADINENTDCGMCMECPKTCPFDNVTLRLRSPGQEMTIRWAGEAWLAMGMLVLAVAYCITHLGHWAVVRDYVNIIDKGNWDLFAVYAAVLWSTALIGLPGLMLALAELARRISGVPRSAWQLMLSSTAALVPIGLAVWIAFVIPMLMVNWSFVRQSFSDPFNWGWDFFGTANDPWHQLFPRAIPWIQVGCVLLGLHYSLRGAWRTWHAIDERPAVALRGTIPISTFLLALSGWLVWFFAC